MDQREPWIETHVRDWLIPKHVELDIGMLVEHESLPRVVGVIIHKFIENREFSDAIFKCQNFTIIWSSN